ncbi:MAG: class C sortase [Clostridium sp.]|uniref:class C sortase n=1 Tax=Clostridium sp. TaxID=1506 RepID=UPI002900D98C|nr:class C sortase [Clostridium sp.]MDU2680336.1 class C sortase [Clostridium sp.]
MKGSKVIPRIIFILGFLICIYPLGSSMIEAFYQREAVATYEKAVNNTSKVDLEKEYKKAEEYNSTLFNFNNSLISSSSLSILGEESYNGILNIGNGIMGSIEIPSINVNLPIYHGTDDEVLSVGVGHLNGTSLPIGGINTKSILTAHRGLPNAKLFTRLDEIVKDDLFFIRVLEETLAYKVIDIKVIEPEDVDDLKIEEGKDLVSLITCTPYGINTHRLVVTGERVPYEKAEYEGIQSKAMSYREIIFASIPFVFLGGAIVFKIRDKKNRKEREHEVKKD